MEDVPIREHMDRLFEVHRGHMDAQFRAIRADMRADRKHKHKGNVSWKQFVTVGLSVAGIAFGIVGIG